MLSIITNPSTTSSQILEQLQNLEESEFRSLLDKLSDAYHNAEPLVGDEQYDLFESLFVSRFGSKLKIGAPPSHSEDEKSPKKKPSKKLRAGMIIRPSGARVQVSALPIPLFGLDKANDDHGLKLFRDRCVALKEAENKDVKNGGHGEQLKFVLTEKLDGCAGYLSIGPRESKLIKRGDEKEGTDISYLLPFLSLPKPDHQMTVKVELVMPRKTWQDKYSEDYKNPRNMVAGITNAKEIEAEKIKDLHVVAFHIYDEDLPNYHRLQSTAALSKLRSLGFHIPNHNTIFPGDLNADKLTTWVREHKLTSEYDIDGVCIVPNIDRAYDSDRNPQHVMAFKIVGETGVTEIIRMEWEVSKRGLWMPVAIIKPIQLAGATIQRVTCYHANFVRENGCGPGAIVIVIRSGDTIPKIIQVPKKATPQYPDRDWKWVETEDGSDPVDICFTGVNRCPEQEIAQICAFFKERGAEYLGEKTITRLYEGGFDSLKKLFGAEIQDIIKIPGFKNKSAERIVNNIKTAITAAPLAEIMAGSCLFPTLGSKRLRLIIEAIPNILELESSAQLEDARKKIVKINGIGEKLADVFCKYFFDFKAWLKEHDEIMLEDSSEDILIIPVSDRKEISSSSAASGVTDIEDEKSMDLLIGTASTTGKLAGEVIVFTGCRADRLMERAIRKEGGSVGSAISGKTTILVVKNREKITKKMEKAQEQGVKIVSWEQFSAEWSV